MTSLQPPLDAHTPLAWTDDALADLSDQGLLRTLTARGTPQSVRIEIDGVQLVNFGSNDYLGLANEPQVIDAAVAACRKFGLGSGASPLVTGRTTLHAELERRLAEFFGAEAALTFPTGFAANAGTVPALVDRSDTIFADAKNHASLIDGCRLARAERHVYPHADCGALAALLRQSSGARRRLIVTDTLFSMDGDMAPLSEILDLAERYDAMVLLDEAHAIGVFGERGRGVVEHLGLEETARARSVIRMGTLSKALGSSGGFVCGPDRLIQWLANRARSYVFSTASPAPVAAAAMAALTIVQEEPHRGRELLDRARAVHARLQRQGWNTGRSSSHIIPVIVGQPDAATTLSAALRERGYLVPGIRPPTVPQGESLLRISLCWPHTEEMIEGLSDALAASQICRP